MSRKNLICAVIGAHVFVFVFFALTGGCAREKKGAKLTTAAPAQEIRAPEGEPEAILEPKEVAEEKELLVSQGPEMIPAKAESPAAETPVAAAAEKEAGKEAVAPEEKVTEGKVPIPSPGREEAAKKQVVAGAPAAVSAPTPQLSGMTHKVVTGDSLWKVSRTYGVSVSDLARANNLKPDAHVRLGQVLVIPAGAKAAPEAQPVAEKKEGMREVAPPPREGAVVQGPIIPAPAATPHLKAAPGEMPKAGRHVVQKGETLSLIAKRYRVSLKKIVEANGIKDPRKIRAGQVLVIPQ